MDDSNSLRETFDCVGPGYPVEPRSKTEAPCIRTRHSERWPGLSEQQFTIYKLMTLRIAPRCSSAIG